MTHSSKKEDIKHTGELRHISLFSSDLDYLQEELNWIEVRARRLHLLHKVEAMEGQRADEHLSDTHYYDDESGDRSVQEQIQRYQEQETTLRNQIDTRLHRHHEVEKPLAIDRLCTLYELEDFERTLLLLALAPCFSRSFDNLYGKLERGDYYSNGLSVETAYNFCRLSFAERIQRRTHFAPKSPLLRNDLLTLDMDHRYSTPKDLLHASIRITHRTFCYMIGDNTLDDAFLEFSSVEEPKVSLSQVVLEPDSKRRILSVVEQHERYLTSREEWGFDEIIRYGRGILMLFYGEPGTGKTMMAHAIANHMNKRVLNVDIPTFLQHHETERFLPGLFREARLQNAILFFDECEVLFGSRHHGNMLMTILLTELERFEGVAILATNLPESLDPALDRRILVKVPFPAPDRQARLEIWKKHIPQRAPIASDVRLDSLADRFEMTGGYIKNAVLMAVAAAVHDAQDPPQITMEHLEVAAQEQLQQPTDSNPQLVLSQVRLSEVTLPPQQMTTLQQIVTTFRHRRLAFERWKVGHHIPHGKGITALFEGPAGSGKTFCAHALSFELNRPMKVHSFRSLITDSIAQTEQNLARLFQETQEQSDLLLLEDLDQILQHVEQKGTMEFFLRHLLQQLEQRDQLTLLTMRPTLQVPHELLSQIQFHLQLTNADSVRRQQLWEHLLPSVATDESVDTHILARQFPLSGREIRQAVFQAACLAASQETLLSQTHLLQAAQAQLEKLAKKT